MTSRISISLSSAIVPFPVRWSPLDSADLPLYLYMQILSGVKKRTLQEEAEWGR